MTAVAAAASPQLSTIERVIYERLQVDECSIRMLYHASFGVAHSEIPDSRSQQQRLGPYVARLNKKLEDRGERVVPGVARRTYCLEKTKTVA